MRTKVAVTGAEDVSLSLGPLIDVTFQLLIFFMCAMRFKTLERKLEASLPKDRGTRNTLERFPEREKIVVDLRRGEGEDRTRIRLLGQDLGAGEEGFARLDTAIRGIRSSPDSEEFPGFIAAQSEVPHGDVIRCLDSFVAAGVATVEFEGARLPGPSK
ncbi:MAG: biopolymer transporter ExbD [Planctomycetes bacterium]|jgi:biopolymer transport protein ExbD|nr:biopolymer transporter ExbD [Planctomycetota bacterium]